MKIVQVALLATVWALAASKKSYEGYKVISVYVPNEQVADLLVPFEHKLDFWTPIRIGHDVHIMLPPNERDLMTVLMDNNLEFKASIDDLKEYIRNHEALVEATRAASDPKQGFDLDVYHTYDEIQAFLRDTASKNFKRIIYCLLFFSLSFIVDNFATCSLENIGKTWEGRDMNVLKICSGNCGDNPVMYMECSK